jgi:hypothetical protein
VGDQRLEDLSPRVIHLPVGEAERPHVLAKDVNAIRVLASAALAANLG